MASASKPELDRFGDQHHHGQHQVALQRLHPDALSARPRRPLDQLERRHPQPSRAPVQAPSSGLGSPRTDSADARRSLVRPARRWAQSGSRMHALKSGAADWFRGLRSDGPATRQQQGSRPPGARAGANAIVSRDTQLRRPGRVVGRRSARQLRATESESRIDRASDKNAAPPGGRRASPSPAVHREHRVRRIHAPSCSGRSLWRRRFSRSGARGETVPPLAPSSSSRQPDRAAYGRVMPFAQNAQSQHVGAC